MLHSPQCPGDVHIVKSLHTLLSANVNCFHLFDGITWVSFVLSVQMYGVSRTRVEQRGRHFCCKIVLENVVYTYNALRTQNVIIKLIAVGTTKVTLNRTSNIAAMSGSVSVAMQVGMNRKGINLVDIFLINMFSQLHEISLPLIVIQTGKSIACMFTLVHIRFC